MLVVLLQVEDTVVNETGLFPLNGYSYGRCHSNKHTSIKCGVWAVFKGQGYLAETLRK
jgi:hypothetical protein